MEISREKFSETNWKMSYEEYKTCCCSQCRRKCIHREAYRRVPVIDGGLGLCPNLIYRTQKIKTIILAKCKERETAGYNSLTDSDVMDIVDECEQNGFEISRSELQKYGSQLLEDIRHTISIWT